MKRFALAVLAVCLLAAPAMAQVDAPKETRRPSPPVRHRLDFSTQELEGSTQGPSLNYVLVPRRPFFPNRIRVRADFAPELFKSADAL